MPSSHLILGHPLLLLPPIPPSIRVFSSESTLLMRWPKDWSFSFSIIPSKEIPGLISFRMDWLDLLAVQGTLKCLLQHHSSKASILRSSAFFTVQYLSKMNDGFPGGAVIPPRKMQEMARDGGSIPGSGRSPGVGNGNPFQYPCLDREAWWATVHEVSQSWT